MEKMERILGLKKDKYSRSPPTLCQWGNRRATTALSQRAILSMIIWNSPLDANLQIFFSSYSMRMSQVMLASRSHRDAN